MIPEEFISYEKCHEYARSLCGQHGIPQCDVADVGSDAYVLSLVRACRAEDSDDPATVAQTLMYTSVIDVIRRRNKKSVSMLSYVEDVREPSEEEEEDAPIVRREGAPVTLAERPRSAAAQVTLAACTALATCSASSLRLADTHAAIDDDWQHPFWLRLFENERDKIARDKKCRRANDVIKAGLKDSRLRLVREKLNISGERFSGILDFLKVRFALCFQALRQYRQLE